MAKNLRRKTKVSYTIVIYDVCARTMEKFFKENKESGKIVIAESAKDVVSRCVSDIVLLADAQLIPSH